MLFNGTDNLEEAARTFEEGIERDPNAIELMPLAASIFAQLGRRQEAREIVIKWRPGARQVILKNAPYGYEFSIRWGKEHTRVRERLIDGLHVAVLPLDTTVSSLVGKLKLGVPYLPAPRLLRPSEGSVQQQLRRFLT